MKIVFTAALFAVICLAAVWLNSFLRERTLRQRWETCLLQAREILAGVKAQYPNSEGVMCAVTQMLETTATPAAASKNLTHEDFLDQLNRVDPAVTPFMSSCKTIVKLKAHERSWNTDVFPSPKGAVGRAEGEAAGTGDDWTSNMRKVGNIGQGFSRQWGIGWILESLPQIAGVSDPLAYAKASAYLMLKKDVEVALCSRDQAAIIDGGSGLGSLGAGYFKMIDPANAYTGLSNYAAGKPPNNCAAASNAVVTGALTSVVNRALFKTVALALRQTAKQRKNWKLLAGLTLRQAITDLTLPAQATSTSTAASSVVSTTGSQVMVYTRAEDDPVMGSSIDIIVTDWGQIRVIETDWTGSTKLSSAGTAITNVDSAATARALSTWNSEPKDGVIIDPENLFLQWGIPWFTEELARDGSGRRFDAKGFVMLGVGNPSLGGSFYLT